METPVTAAPPDAKESSTSITPETRQVLDAVGFEATHTDQIVARTGLNAGDVQVQLMILELAGLVRADRGGVLRVR